MTDTSKLHTVISRYTMRERLDRVRRWVRKTTVRVLPNPVVGPLRRVYRRMASTRSQRVAMTMTPALETYRLKFAATPGFFQDAAIATWDFLLLAQAQMNIPGNFLEIGVFRGKSALLAACHMKPGEFCILNDISPIDEVVTQIRSLKGPDVHVTLAKSSSLITNRDLAGFHGTARWVHIDGDHAGYSVMNDLRVAEWFLADRGIICVDDFFSGRYPQVTAAVYKFLFDTSPLYRMFLCGAGKCYLVRSADYAMYERLVREHLARHLVDCGQSITIHKSTYSHDMGCFSFTPREHDADYLGLDAATTDIPF